MFLYPSEIDERLTWPAGRALKLAKRRRLPHVLLPDGSIRFEWSEIEPLIQHIVPDKTAMKKIRCNQRHRRTKRIHTSHWLPDNLNTLLPYIIGGIIGFYAAVRAVDASIANVRNDLTKLQTLVEKSIEPKADRIDDAETRMNEISQRIQRLEQTRRAFHSGQLGFEPQRKRSSGSRRH